MSFKALAVDGPRRGSLITFDNMHQRLTVPVARRIQVTGDFLDTPLNDFGFDEFVYRVFMIGFGSQTIAVATVGNEPGMRDVFDLLVTEKAKAAVYGE